MALGGGESAFDTPAALTHANVTVLNLRPQSFWGEKARQRKVFWGDHLKWTFGAMGLTGKWGGQFDIYLARHLNMSPEQGAPRLPQKKTGLALRSPGNYRASGVSVAAVMQSHDRRV